MESLYPFLYSDTSDLSAVLDQVRASTVAKVEEIDVMIAESKSTRTSRTNR